MGSLGGQSSTLIIRNMKEEQCSDSYISKCEKLYRKPFKNIFLRLSEYLKQQD